MSPADRPGRPRPRRPLLVTAIPRLPLCTRARGPVPPRGRTLCRLCRMESASPDSTHGGSLSRRASPELGRAASGLLPGLVTGPLSAGGPSCAAVLDPVEKQRSVAAWSLTDGGSDPGPASGCDSRGTCTSVLPTRVAGHPADGLSVLDTTVLSDVFLQILISSLLTVFIFSWSLKCRKVEG